MNQDSPSPDSDELDAAIAASLDRSFQPPAFDAGDFAWHSPAPVSLLTRVRPLMTVLLAAGLGVASVVVYSNANSSSTVPSETSGSESMGSVSEVVFESEIDDCDKELSPDSSTECESE